MRDTPTDFVRAFQKHGSIKAVARQEGVSYRQARNLYVAAVDAGLMTPLRVGVKSRGELKKPEPLGRVKERTVLKWELPPTNRVARYLFTCAQNDTKLHAPLWQNLLALKEHYQAEIHVARLTYVRAGPGAKGDKQEILRGETIFGGKDMTWAAELQDYFSDDRAQVAPGLMWCGEVNIIPTADRPLSGFESYTGRKSGIFPHTKFAMVSVPSMADEGTKFNYTTGTVTQRNHISRKAGLKADFHHGYGALLAEVDEEGNWWCRQLVADSDGTIYDLDVRVKDGVVEQGGNWIDTIVWGDVHVSILDQEQFDLIWGEGGLLDKLQPRRQFLHDVLNFTARSHHEAKDPIKRFLRHTSGQDNVLQEIVQAAQFLECAERDFCETIVVNSNHDRHLGRWLRDEDARYDPVNFAFWSALWCDSLAIAREVGAEPNYFELAMGLVPHNSSATILARDASYVICEDDSGGIECGLHGDEGPNGSRGSALGFAKMGRKMIVGHTHSAGIVDGVYTVGTHCNLRPDYTHGPGSWSHTFCVVYENGKRSLITIWNGRERA